MLLTAFSSTKCAFKHVVYFSVRSLGVAMFVTEIWIFFGGGELMPDLLLTAFAICNDGRLKFHTASKV